MFKYVFIYFLWLYSHNLQAVNNLTDFNCAAALTKLELFKNPEPYSQTKKPTAQRSTKIESVLSEYSAQQSTSQKFADLLAQLKNDNYKLYKKVLKSKRIMDRGGSLQLDFSHLPAHMVNFINGSYKSVVGARGISAPFVRITAIDNNTLKIVHSGDKYPLLIRWSDKTERVSTVKLEEIEKIFYRVLEVPVELKSETDLKLVEPKHIYKLISASRLNKNISSSSSAVMTLAAIIHDKTTSFNRASQEDADVIRALMDTDHDFKMALNSLLFVAPTAAGKTKILANAIKSKIEYTNKRLAHESDYDKKLIVLMTKTPDLTTSLSKAIGEQMTREVGRSKFRIVQWGGSLSEPWKFNELEEFVQNSEVPVVLVTSYPTLGIRTKLNDQLNRLLQMSNILLVDEVHNSTGKVFSRVLELAKEVSRTDRLKEDVFSSLDIMGVTASPINRIQRTVELFKWSFWSSIDSINSFKKQVLDYENSTTRVKDHKKSLDWQRVMTQFVNAGNRGEINAPESIMYYKAKERGFKFSSIFKRAQSGSHSLVDLKKLEMLWPDIVTLLEHRSRGIIHTYPRDSKPVADLLSSLTGENFVALQTASQKQKELIYSAFKNNTEYKGRKVYALVGAIREGLDFPESGWYLSFEKYVKFPKIIQGPGRVVRLALDKLPPRIIMFGTDNYKMAFSDAAELVLRKLGKKPRRLSSSRMYTGARKTDLTTALGVSIDKLNNSLEAVVRIHYEKAREIGFHKTPNLEALSQIHDIITKMRRANSHIEIVENINNFIAEVNSYPFFRGTLNETWKFTNRIIRLKKQDNLDLTKLSEEEVKILSNDKLFKMVQDFRKMKSWLGVAPRMILMDYHLAPLTIKQVGHSINIFIRNNAQIPYSTSNVNTSLREYMNEIIGVSPVSLNKSLNNRSRKKLARLFIKQKYTLIEESYRDFYLAHGYLPRFYYNIIDSPKRNITDDVSHKLAKRIEPLLLNGTLDLSYFSPEMLHHLDESKLFVSLVEKAMGSISELKEFIHKSESSFVMGFEDLLELSEFGILKVVGELAELGYVNSNNFKKTIQSALKHRAL